MPSFRFSPVADRTEIFRRDRNINIDRPHVPSVLSVLPFPSTIDMDHEDEGCVRSGQLKIEDTMENLQDKQDRQDIASIDNFILVLSINYETGQTVQFLDKIIGGY